jgi:hypothetical protein
MYVAVSSQNPLEHIRYKEATTLVREHIHISSLIIEVSNCKHFAKFLNKKHSQNESTQYNVNNILYKLTTLRMGSNKRPTSHSTQKTAYDNGTELHTE